MSAKEQPTDSLTPSSSSSSIPSMLAPAGKRVASSAAEGVEWEKEKMSLYQQLDQKVQLKSMEKMKETAEPTN